MNGFVLLDLRGILCYTALQVIDDSFNYSWLSLNGEGSLLTLQSLQCTMISIKFLNNLQFHRRLLQREMPLLPNLSMPCCDVRDVAAAHITAMTSPKSPGR